MKSGSVITIVAAALCLAGTLALPARAEQLPSERLYKGAAPGTEAFKFGLIEQKTPTGVTLSNVRDPDITAYLPDPAKANGAAVIALPGGGLRVLGLGKENQDIITRFNERGIAVIVLKYRTAQTDPNAPGRAPAPPPAAGAAPPSITFPKMIIRNANANPAPNDDHLSLVLKVATADAQEAMRRVRSHAKEWRIDPNRIGMIGSSAGGGVAVGAILGGDPAGAPNFFISLYGPSLQDVKVPADAPPIFLATESNHGPVTDGLIALFSLWKDAGKPAELHVYEVRNFAMPVSLWADRAFEWLAEQKIIPPQ